MKHLRVRMPDQSEFEIPAEVIARNRAEYYVDSDPDTTYKAEFDYAMDDDDELEDWAQNNMNWSDVEKFAVLVNRPQQDFQKGWAEGEMWIVESD